MYARPMLGAALILALAFCGISAIRPSDALAETAVQSKPFAPAFADKDLSEMVSTLEAAFATSPGTSRWLSNAKTSLWNFTRKIQSGSMNAKQEETVLRHIDQLGRQYPEAATAVGQSRRIVTHFTVGKAAPEIIGNDLEGKPMRLSEYRGRVVVLSFSGHWCGICRSAYPHERTLIERYGASGFSFLGVNSDADPKLAQQAYLDNGLTFRSWWDGPRGGAIASAWEITGWPTTYVLDAQGIIRFVDLRQDDLLNSVADLLSEPGTR